HTTTVSHTGRPPVSPLIYASPVPAGPAPRVRRGRWGGGRSTRPRPAAIPSDSVPDWSRPFCRRIIHPAPPRGRTTRREPIHGREDREEEAHHEARPLGDQEAQGPHPQVEDQ